MIRVFGLLFLGVLLTLLPSCESNRQPDDPNQVSKIPWNTPEKWESQGPLGGFTPNTQ